MHVAWGVRGPAKFDTYNHLRMGASRLVVCMPFLRECGSLNGLERRYVATRYLKCRLARHLGSPPDLYFSINFAWLRKESFRVEFSCHSALMAFSRSSSFGPLPGKSVFCPTFYEVEAPISWSPIR